MRTAAMSVILLTVAVGTSEAQSRQGIPPGQMPRAGQCRVWYDGLPPGRQPAPTSCDQAERIASRSRNARVIYGDDRYSRSDDWRYRDRDNGVYDRRYPNDRNRGYGNNSAAFDNGYRDGLEKGREDARDNDSFDPVRHSRYRSGDRGYNSRYGTRDAYKLAFGDGFESGYAQAYRASRGYGANRGNTGGFRLPRF
jgi:hypothetical protein